MLSKYRKISVFVTILALLLLGTGVQKANACHWGSGEIYVTYIGTGTDGCTGTTDYKYLVNLEMYYACQTCTGEADSVQLHVSSGATGRIDGNNWWLTRVEYDTVSQICPQYWYKNSCLDISKRDSFPAYKRIVFQKVVSVPSAQPDWVFGIQPGSARPSPANINNGTFYVETMLNNLSKYNNSSPRFTTSPLAFVCVHEVATFLNGPYDINGDSMVVSYYEPLRDAGTPIGFQTGYGLNNYVDTDPGGDFVLDPLTGKATFIPSKTGTYQIAFRIDKYERGTGTFLGYSMRDFNVQVMICAEPPPPLDEVPTTISEGVVVEIETQGRSSKVIYTCPGSELRFDVTSTAQFSTSELYMVADLAEMPSGVVFNAPANGSSSVTGTFTWTPTLADVGDHTLTIHSKDSTCSGVGYTIVRRSQTVYTIRVTPGIDLGPDIAICAVDTKPEQLFVQRGEHLRLRWEEFVDGVKTPGSAGLLTNPTIQNPIARVDTAKNIDESVVYRVESPDLVGSTCKNDDTVSLYYDTSTTMELVHDETVILCKPDFVQLEALIKGDQPTGNVPCGSKGAFIDCLTPTELELYGSPSYGKNTAYDTLGTSSPVLVNKSKSSKHEYIIPRAELEAYGMRGGTLKSLSFEVALSPPPGDTLSYKNFTIRMGCTNREELEPAAGFTRENDLQLVFSDVGPITFKQGTYKFNFSEDFNRDTAMGLIIQICYSNPRTVDNCTHPQGSAPILRFVPTSYTSGLFLTSNVPGVNTVCDVITADSMVARTARPKFTFGYCEAPPTNFTFWWKPGTLTSDSSIKQPLAYVPKTTKYLAETYGRSGCLLRDSVVIYVPDNHYEITPFDTAICYGTDAIMTVEGGFYYRWFEYTEETNTYTPATTVDCNTCKTVRARPFENTHYRVAVFDSVFCLDTIDAWVTVLPRPEVKLLTGDTIIKYGQSIPLLATGARQYNWMPSSSLSTPNTSSPIATPTEPTTYVVTGIGSNGCRSFDTVEVDIDYRDNILVPTAFSPNGDGRNDLFRVANLTFQQIMEFRIFNRWGQEVFSTHDARTGWDGTWQGVDQPIDNYRYIIRVGFPDGLVETYKGDVTLVR